VLGRIAVSRLSVYAINFKALDFVFLMAFFAGIMAMRKLALVKEEGEVPENNSSGPHDDEGDCYRDQ
jgi:hypothetical protein